MAPDIIERLRSVSIASALSSALAIYPCQIRAKSINTDSLNYFLQLGRTSISNVQWKSAANSWVY